jgi:hypothetical protein
MGLILPPKPAKYSRFAQVRHTGNSFFYRFFCLCNLELRRIDQGAYNMKFSHAWAVAVTGIILSPMPNASAQKEGPMTTHGAFEVKLTAQPPDDKSADTTIARYTLDKQFHGDLEGTSKGQMLAASTDEKGSGGYVAIERVTGTLSGRTGSFTLQHSGTMTGGAFHLEIKVVPDSGTGQLIGLTGSMTIQISPDGKHSYFTYSVPKTE